MAATLDYRAEPRRRRWAWVIVAALLTLTLAAGWRWGLPWVRERAAVLSAQRALLDHRPAAVPIATAGPADGSSWAIHDPWQTTVETLPADQMTLHFRLVGNGPANDGRCSPGASAASSSS